MTDERCCGNCKYHFPIRMKEGITSWLCVNGKGDNCGYWTDYDHTCEDWEERKSKMIMQKTIKGSKIGLYSEAEIEEMGTRILQIDTDSGHERYSERYGTERVYICEVDLCEVDL